METERKEAGDVPSGAAKAAWYRSLYWRIALGFIVCVAILLVAQATLFVWLAGRFEQSSRSPSHFVTVVASNLAAVLESDPQTDVERSLRDEFGRGPQRLIVVMRDGRVFKNREFPEPVWLVRAATVRLRREARDVGVAPERPDTSPSRAGTPGADDGSGDLVAPGETAQSGSGRSGPVRDAAAPRPRRSTRRLPQAPIVVRGETIGLVTVVPGQTPGAIVLAELGPTLALTGLVLLFSGTAIMAFFVFRPARRRLRAVERAAQAIGSGDTAARAPETGGDEVAALAHSFNKMAADLEARVRELQESDRARRQLFADVSHELMTPLTAMRGYLETLAVPAAVPDAETRERYLRIVTEETLRLESIIGDLLDLARLEGGGTPLNEELVPVDSLFSRAAARHEAALREKSLTLDARVAPGAEAVHGDPRRLEQAVQNLVANAVRHTPAGGRIELDAVPDGDRRVVLRVEDTGPGIPPEHLAKVFDRFYRVDAARDQASGGSGLGLSIVRAIVERHGGRVTVSSAPGGGARFEVVLEK